jgi:hypothetical protein
LIGAKVQTHPTSSKKWQELAQNSKYTFEDLRIKIRADMRWYCLFGSRLTKNPILTLQKVKCTFHGKKQKTAFLAFLAVPKATHVSDIGFFLFFVFFRNVCGHIFGSK